MTEEELLARLLFDLSNLNLPVGEVDVSLRPFSKTYYGRYFPVYNDDEVKPKIFIYPYANTKSEMMDYDQILQIAIHEFCHHVQYTSGSFSRVRGVMHDTQFWQLYNHYCKRAVNKEIMGGGSFECKAI